MPSNKETPGNKPVPKAKQTPTKKPAIYKSIRFRVVLGWILISTALAISVYANLNCNWFCEGVWGQVLNPLSVPGGGLYIAGTIVLLSTLLKNENAQKA
ncbi:MAG: hypothetical protein JW772_00525 [Candidatus Diapherotrites archaeon]|nr:hypothetical protein [Candidatus Diapherotrites archaeon]